MLRNRDPRWEQLRAVEADLLDPPPEDPFNSAPSGWTRASDLTVADWKNMSARFPAPPPPRDPSPIPTVQCCRQRQARRSAYPPRAQRAPMRSALERRPLTSRQQANQIVAAPYQRFQPAAPALVPAPIALPVAVPAPIAVAVPVPPAPEPRRRPLSPTQLPGVRAIPKDYNHYFRGLLTPGEYFAKSKTRYLGPFDEVPCENSLPRGDDYIILQRMGRLPDSGKSIFRQVGNVSN